MIGRLVFAACLFLNGNANADDAPKIIAARPNGPLELRVLFDRQVPADTAKTLVGKRIVFGDDVKPGERFIEGKPTDAPPKTERGSLRITAARLIQDGKTLVLATDPHARDTSYVLSISKDNTILYNLKGVELCWATGDSDTKPSWVGWWPELSNKIAVERLQGTTCIEELERVSKEKGRLTLKTLLTLPKGKATIKVKASGPIEVNLGNESGKSKEVGGEHVCEVSSEVEFDVLDLAVILTHDGSRKISVVAKDGADKPLLPTNQTLAWAPPIPPKPVATPVPAELLAGGDPIKGAAVFKSEQAKCATCHKVQGVGGEVGPDLSNLVHRDRDWIYRNIAEPSGTIQPDYLTYTVLIKDGRVLNGIVRAEGADAIKVVDTEGKSVVVSKAEIEELKPGTASIMPVGLIGTIGEANMKDLLAYLTTKAKS
jgi:putative heme-binding domain-containing protein